MRVLPSFPMIRTVATLTVRIGGVESAREVSPSESSSQRLWTFLVPGLTPHEAKESGGSRGLSHSERDCGVAKRRWRGLGLGWDMVEILRNLRGFKGQVKNGIFRVLEEDEEEREEEEKRKKIERAAKRKSAGLPEWCGRGVLTGRGDGCGISTMAISGVWGRSCGLGERGRAHPQRRR